MVLEYSIKLLYACYWYHVTQYYFPLGQVRSLVTKLIPTQHPGEEGSQTSSKIKSKTCPRTDDPSCGDQHNVCMQIASWTKINSQGGGFSLIESTATCLGVGDLGLGRNRLFNIYLLSTHINCSGFQPHGEGTCQMCSKSTISLGYVSDAAVYNMIVFYSSKF